MIFKNLARIIGYTFYDYFSFVWGVFCESCCQGASLCLSLWLKSSHFIYIHCVKKAVFYQSALKIDSITLFYFYPCRVLYVCVWFSRVFYFLTLHKSIFCHPRVTAPAVGTHMQTSETVDLWLSFQADITDVSGGKIKGYHLSVNALSTISFPPLCTTSTVKAGFLSIRLHEYNYFPLVKPRNDAWFVLYYAFWNYNMNIFFSL